MVFTNTGEKGVEKQDSHYIQQREFGFERGHQTFVENVEYHTSPTSMDEMLTSILKDLEIAEVNLKSTSHLLEPTNNDSDFFSKYEEIAEIKPDSTMANLKSVLQEIKAIEVGESASNLQNDKDYDLSLYEQELKHLPLCLETKEVGDSEENTSPSKDLPLFLRPKENRLESSENFEEDTSPSKDLPLCSEPRENIFDPLGDFHEETIPSEETSDIVSNLQVDKENFIKDCSEEMELQPASSKLEDKVLFKIPFLSSNPYVNFVQDFQAKYKGEEVTPSMMATLALTKWRKMGIEERQVYKNIKKNHCEKNKQLIKLKGLIKALNASEESVFL